MPSAPDHLAQASHNKDLVSYLRKDEENFPDWVITAAFYITIHLLERYFAHRGPEHSKNHNHRENILNSYTELKPINRAYFELKRLSTESRYQRLYSVWTPPEAQAALDLVREIEQHLSSLP
jgi:hypothetical protein